MKLITILLANAATTEALNLSSKWNSGKWVDDTMNYDWSCGWNSKTQDWHKMGTNGCLTGPKAVKKNNKKNNNNKKAEPVEEPVEETPTAQPNTNANVDASSG